MTETATLSQKAKINLEQGDLEGAIGLYVQAAESFAKEKAYADVVTVLGNLARIDESNSKVYLAQAIWLSLAIELPFQGLLRLFLALFQLLPQDNDIVPLIGTTIIYSCSEFEEEHPELEKYQELGISILQATALARGIEGEEAFKTWFVENELDDPDLFLVELIEKLEACVGDNWLFDRAEFN